MPSPHAEFAAVTYVSEALINQCLESYLNNHLNGLSGSISQFLPVVIGGRSLRFDATADAALISVRATLKKNAYGKIFLTFRFYATAQLDVFAQFDPRLAPPDRAVVPIESYNPEIVIDAAVTASLIARVDGDQYHFAVDMPGSSIDSIKVVILTPGGLPDSYRSDLIKLIESPFTRGVLYSLLSSIPPEHLRATPGTAPAFYEFNLNKPVQTNQVWARARIDVSRLVCLPLDGCLAVAVDVAGPLEATLIDYEAARFRQYFYNSGHIHDLAYNFENTGYWPRGAPNLVSFTNLDFLEIFLAQRVLPQMKYAFVQNNFRIDKMFRFEFFHREMVNGPIDNVRVVFEASYWTHSGFDFFVRGTTRVGGINVSVICLPYVADGSMHVNVGPIEADLPDWVKFLLFTVSLVLPPVTLLLPAALKMVLKNSLVDVSAGVSKNSAEHGVSLTYDFDLPGTAGPNYVFEPRGLRFDCRPGFRYAQTGALIRRTSVPSLSIRLDDEISVAVRSEINRQEIRKEGGLPGKMVATLSVPRGLVQTKDPTLRVCFETYLNGMPVPEYTRDMRYGSVLPLLIGGPPIKANVLDIDTIRFVPPHKLDQEVRIYCRLYRSMGGITEDLFSDSVYILSVDSRPDDVKPFVQWAHRVTYYTNHKRVQVVRRSKIHKVPGKGGCRFSNQYLVSSFSAKGKFYSIRRFTGLPFEMRDINDHRDKVCPYCFFGGPDKFVPVTSKFDITGAVGKVFKP